MFHCTEGPIWTWRLPQRNMSLSLKVARPFERRTSLPIREQAGSRSALPTPIWADWATACSSALRMSGRRRSRSAGMPTMTRGGETGIVDGPDSRSLRSFGGMPSSTLRSEEHTSELQSRLHLVCRLLLEKKKNEAGSYAAEL